MSIRTPTTVIHTKYEKKDAHVECFGCKEKLEEIHAG